MVAIHIVILSFRLDHILCPRRRRTGNRGGRVMVMRYWEDVTL